MIIRNPRGVLRLKTAASKFRLTLHGPSPDLAAFIAHYWIVEWDLTGQPPYRQEVLPHPSVHLVLEGSRAEVFGVMRGKFAYLLEGRGRVLGLKFKPGAFHPFVGTPVSRLTDRKVDVSALFGAEGELLDPGMLQLEDHAQLIARAEAFLRACRPEPDERMETAGQLVEQIMSDRTLMKVEDLVEATGIGMRRLQRLFSEYVGVSPKWVIQRYRLHEAIEKLAEDEPLDGATLAQELGYFDQAHFIRDFRALVGQTPAEYAQGAGS